MRTRTKKRAPDINLLELIPERIIASETGAEGLVTILAPRFGNRFLKRLFEPRLKRPFLKIRLDEIGSAAWQNIDGERSVGEIGGIMRERFGESIEPCYDRLALFFTHLEVSRYISYRNLEEIKGRRRNPDQ